MPRWLCVFLLMVLAPPMLGTGCEATQEEPYMWVSTKTPYRLLAPGRALPPEVTLGRVTLTGDECWCAGYSPRL